MKYGIIVLILFGNLVLNAQDCYWQQKVDYKMDIDFDVEENQFDGHQILKYTNNSPDTLHKVFYHLYFNAFQPGSMMDERSRTISDPDRRVGSRIAELLASEIGYQKIESLKQDGKPLKYIVEGTILEVALNEPILPGKTTVFDMKFKGQVPIQIRRSGRDSYEGIDFSMTQWYPKLSEYDVQGWNANPYIAREFHGVWGDFDVSITMDSKYIIGATGILQNPQEIGYGYQAADSQEPKRKKEITWHFKAENVIDFAWAADRDYKHISKVAHDGTMLHFIFQPAEGASENWALLPSIMDEALKFINANYGKYQFPQYTFIQGGDGGMEYPMITLITGGRNLNGLVGVSVHEWMHSWYQFMLATNESLYPWMDEGFASFASSEVMNHLRKIGKISGNAVDNPHAGTTQSYVSFSKSGLEESLTTHSDHYATNSGYSRGAYTKGSVFLSQLEYVIGEKPFRRGLLRYFNTWKFKHPTPNDLIRIMEKESGIELDWYKEYFVYTTKTIDYGIVNVEKQGKMTKIGLSKIGLMPMPLDIEITKKDGTKEMHYIPMAIMRGEKEFSKGTNVVIEKDWAWTNSSYSFIANVDHSEIESIKIDPSGRMADTDISNNELIIKQE